MGKIQVNIDVQDNDVADRIEKRISDGISESAKERNEDSLGRIIKEAARTHIKRHGRVWTTKLLNSFEISSEEQSGNLVLVVSNSAGHAAAIDTGAEYGDEGPPLHRLIPWVQQKMRGYRISGGQLVTYDNDHGGIVTDGSGRKFYVTKELPDDHEAGTAVSFSEISTSAGVNRDSAYIVDYPELDDRAYFQEYKSVDLGSGGISGSQFGTVRNEELFTRVSMETDWQLGPENAGGAVIDPANDEILEGNFQAWIYDSEHLRNHLEQPHHPASEDFTWTPTEFLEEHGDWFSKTSAVDILIGNGDRHAANIVIDNDNIPHAIDNGGHSLPSGSALSDRISTSSIHLASEFQDIDFYDGLEQQLIDHFDRQLDYVEELLRNHGDAILEHTKDVHGKNSALYARMEALIDANVDDVLAVIQEKQDKSLRVIRGSDTMSQDEYEQISHTLSSNGLSLDTDDEGLLNDVLEDFDSL